MSMSESFQRFSKEAHEQVYSLDAKETRAYNHEGKRNQPESHDVGERHSALP